MSIIREITTEVKKYIKDDKILLLVGARQAGKTTILKQIQLFLEERKKLVYFLNLIRLFVSFLFP